MSHRESTFNLSSLALLGAAALLPVLLFLAANFPDSGRLWGVAWWNHYASVAVPAFISVGLLVGSWLLSRRLSTAFALAVPTWLYVTLSMVIVTSYLLFRTQTHFLGDGYALLGAVSGDIPFLKERNFGGMLLPYWLMNLLGGPSADHALLAYRIVSVFSGIVFMAISYGIARAICFDPVDRFLIWLGLNLGGYGLLFCGYVENYAPFVVAVALFCYSGIRVERGELRVWWLVPAWLLTTLMHVFGWALFPAFLYLMLPSAKSESRFSNRRIKWFIWLAFAIGGICLFGYLYATNLFFRFAFVPVITNRITVEGYTLLSSAHLLDFANLLLVLAPSLLLFLFVGMKQYLHGLREDTHSYRFLSFSSVCLLTVAFFINPMLGMPRDWDLFAMAGVPLSIVVLSTLSMTRRQAGKLILVLAVTMHLTMLASRVAVTANITFGSRMAHDYMQLDLAKNRTLGKTYTTFIQEQYGADSANIVQRQLASLWPDDLAADSGSALMAQGQFQQAADCFGRATLINPLNYGAWANLGKCLIEQQRYDSAASCLRIGSGLNPYNSVIATMRGYAEYHVGNTVVAEEQWKLGRELDTSTVAPLEALARFYATSGNETLALAYLDSIVIRKDAPPEFLQLGVQRKLADGRPGEARALYQRALDAGLDSMQAGHLLEAYPDLR